MVQISLGMTVFNRDRYLDVAIQSVLQQSFTDWELITVDDGSSDQSVAIAQHYVDLDDRISLLHHDGNYGAGYSLWHAISQAQGEFIGWVDSDDELMPNALEVMLAALQRHPQHGAAYSNYRVMNADGLDGGRGWRCNVPYSKEGMLEIFMMFHFQLIRRSVYEQVGGIDRRLPASIEYDLCLRISEVTDVLHVDEDLYRYRQHGDSITTTQRGLQRLHGQLAVKQAIQRRQEADAI